MITWSGIGSGAGKSACEIGVVIRIHLNNIVRFFTRRNQQVGKRLNNNQKKKKLSSWHVFPQKLDKLTVRQSSWRSILGAVSFKSRFAVLINKLRGEAPMVSLLGMDEMLSMNAREKCVFV
jgi:hypothetical protein